MAEETNMEQTPMENNEPVTPPVDVAKVEETPVEPAPKVEPVAPVEPVAAAPVAPEPVKPVQEAKPVQPKPAPVAKKPAPVKEAPVEKPIDIAQKKNQFKDAVLSTKDVSEWSYNYDRGSEKKGKDPYSYQKVFKPIPSNKLGEGLGEFASTKTERALNKDYASPSRDEFDEMASNSLRVLYKQGAWDKYKDSPNFMTSYINNYVNRVSTKNGYYLSDDDKKLLAQRILNDEYPKFNSLAKNIIPAIDRSGIVNRVIEENRGAQNKLAEALSSATSDIKTESQRISTQVNDFYRNDIDKLKSETDAAKKDVQDYTQSLYDSYVGEEYTKRVNTIQQAVNTNNLSIEEARKMVEPGEDGLSPLLREVVDYTNNNAEYIAKRDSYAKEKQDQINKQAYDLNSRMKSDYDTQMNPVYTKVDSNYKKTFDSIQSQVGFTKEDMDKFQRALGQIAKEDQDKEYVRSKSLAESAGIYDLMSSMYLGGGVIAEEFRRGFVGGARDLVTDMYSNLTGRFVNELDFQNVKERISGQGINASLLYERDGLSAAFNPAVIAGTVGQQLPVIASTLVPGLATGTIALNAGRLMNLSKWGLGILAGGVGGATEFAVVGDMVRDEARAQALSTGASPDQVREAERIATNTWIPSAPLYFLQVGALLSPALSFTKKAGTELVTEFTTEHWEGISGTVGVESVTPELDDLGMPTGKTQYKGLSSVISKYVSSPEFLATSAATIWTTAIVGTGISALGSKPKAKIEKATIFDMFSKAGRIVPDAMLDQNLKAGKITQAQYEEGMAKVNAMQSAINKVSDMDISDDVTVYASVDKLYDINILEAKVQATQDPDVKETLTAQLDQAKKELKDITMGKSGVYIRENPGTGPMVMTKQDMDQALNDPEVISAIESNAVRFRVANDNDMVAKLNDAVDGYKKTWKAKVDQMTQTSTEGGRMTVNEAYELAELQTQQEMLTKTGRQLEPEKTARMMELSAKGSVNLAAYERRAQESAKLKGSTPSFVEKAKKAMSKAFPNSTVVSDLEGFIAAATDAIKSSKQASNVVYDAPSKSFIVEYPDRENETIKLSQVSGFNAGGGKIFINPLNKSLDTIVHELGGHSWVNELLAKSNVANVAKPEGGSFTLDEIFNADDKDLNEEARRLKEGLSLMRETDYYEELKLNPFYANKSEASILEEALVQAIGEKGALKIKKTKANADGTISVDPTRLEKIVNWIKDFIKSITGKEAEPGQELADYINSALKDILGTEKLDAEISQAEADRLAQPSGFTDADGNPLNNREVNFMVRNDLIVDVANDVRFNYIKDSDQFKRLLEGDPGNGIAPSITIDKTLSDFAGQTMVLHVPDNSFTGQIFKGEDKVVDGKGGIYYVVRFNDKGYFWASTKGGASVFVNFLNEVRANSKDGKIRMGLVSANQDKLLSSTLNSNAILDIMYSKAFDERVKLTPRQVSSAYVYGINYAKDFINTQIDSKAKKENWSASKIKEEKSKVIFPKILKVEDPISVQNKLKEFFAADVSSFEARKQLNIGMLKGLSYEAKNRLGDEGFKKFSSQFLDFFGELTGNPKVKSTGGRISGSNLVGAISNFLTEPLLKGQKSGNIYAVIEIDGEVEAYDTTGDAEVHESYPIAISSKEGNKPTLHILQDRQNWMENSIDLKTGEKVTEDNELSVLPSNRGLSRPVKLSDNIKKIEIPKDQVRFSVKDDAAKPVGRIFTTPHYAAETVANDYVVDNGLPPIAKTIVRVIDVDRAMKIADAYDAMSDMSNDPDTIAGYKQMGEESVKQFDHMVNNGYTVEVYTKDGEPYATAADMIKDLNENKHLYILATKEDAFGQEGDFQKAQGEEKAKSPLLETSGRFDINGYELLNNDVFRAVHDFFGHAVMGNSFGPVGEENAWLIHSQMYSPLARRAMTSETRMQNSWVNFNTKMRTVEEDGRTRPAKAGEPGYVPLSQRKFAEQKNILSPDWVVDTDVYLKQEPIVGDDTQAKFKVKDDHFPNDKNVNAIRNSKIYSKLTEDGNGNFVFFHASPNQKLDKLGINPDKFGLNVLKTSAEERMRSVPVSMYYVNEDTDVKYTSKYFVKIPKNKVYYFNEDALKLAPKAKKAFEKQALEKGYNLAYTANEQVGYMLLEARKLGYEMLIAKWGNGDARAETNILMKPTKFYDLDGNIVKYVTRERFMTNKDRLRGKKIPKSDMLASERDHRWYEKKVDQLPSADISKDEFMDMMQTGKFVIMTPENPNNTSYFEYENDNLISDFEDEMIRGEFNYIPIIGRYGNYERSFIITDVKQSDVKRLAKQFNQESVAADFGIYYPTKKSFYPRVKPKDSFMDGEMSRDDDFMSTIMTTDGPITFALNYDFEQEKKSGAKFQVVGIQGARNVNGLITNYNSALKMEKKGMSSKQIYAATGWFRDFAGNMAYEIDDANAEIKMYPTSEALPLSDILDHPLLYEMYPFAKNIRVKSYEGDGNEAYFIIDSNGGATIGINSEYVKPDDKEKLYVNLMHEIQHYIQKKEGFDSGSSIDMSVQRLEWIRDSITKMNKAIGKGDYKIPNKQLDRYLKGINIDLSIISTVSNVIKDENDKKKSTLAYWFDYGEMTARYSETPLLQKNIQSTPTVDILGMAEGIAALSTMRVMNIHDAFFNKTGKITTGPGQRINIPGFKVEDDIQRKQIINEKIARGISMKAAANYYAGVKETEEEKEARLLLRDQLMLEIMAAKQAYEQRSSEAAQAALYEARKRDIEEAFRVKDMEDRVSTKLNRKIRREQILSAFRWLGEKEKWQDKIANWEGMKQLIFDRIEEYRKDGSLAGKINGRTLSTFSKMILNATTEKRLNRALAYLDKALEDKQYGELVGNIRDLKATIKQMIRGGKNPFGNYYDSVVELISYDESNLFNPYGDRSFATMELYRDMLEQLARKDMPNFKAYMNDYHLIQDVLEASVDNEIADQTFNEVKTASELNKYIDQFFAAPINNEIDFMAIRKIASAINKRATELYSQGVISADEFAQIFAKISKGSKSEDIEQLEVKNKVRAMEADMFTFAAYRMNLLSSEEFSGDNKTAFNKLRAMLNNPQGIENFRNAGTDAIILLEKIVDQLENGFMSYRIYELINTVEVQASAKSMVEEISKTLVENETKPFRRKLSPSAIKIASDLTGMPKQIVDQALGLGKTRTFYNNIASKLGFSFSALRSSNKELGRTVYKSLQRFGGLMSMPELERYRVGLIMKQLDYQSNIPNFETSEVIKDVTKYLLSDKASELDPKELKAIAKAYESLPKNANGDLDVDAALASLSKREKNLYDTARDLFDKHLSPKVAATNFRRGEIADNQTNYYRRFSQGVRSSEIGDSMTPEEIVRNMETYKIRSGSTMGRVSNGLYWTVIDPESVLFRSINDVNTDYYLSNSVPKSFTVLREASKKAKGQTKAIIDALAILTKDTLVDELTINRRVANPAGLFSLDGMMTRASNQARNLLLSNPTRVVTELIPSVTKYLISEVNIDQLRTFLSSDKSKNAVLYKRLLYDLHLPFKDNITRFALEGGDAGRQSMLSATADAVATFSDALFSKGIFNIAFDESFKNLTGEDFDIERYYNDPQYAAGLESLGVLEKAATDGLYKAERLASSLTQFTTPLSVGFSSRSSAAAKVFGFMMSYNAFESKTFFENLRDVITGENDGRIAGARYTAGVITSNTMYIMLGYFMNQLFKELDFDDDDPIEEEIMNAMKATTDKKSAGNLLMASVANLIVGGYGVSFKLGLGFLIGLYDSLKLSGYSIDKEISDIADEVSAVAKEYAYVSGINFSDRYGATSISDATSFIPLFGIYLTPAIEGLDFVAAYDKKSRGEEVSNEEELNYRLAIALHALANFAGLQYPGIGLVHKKLKSSASSEAKKAKTRKEYEKEMKSMEKSSAPQLPAVDSLQSEIQYEVPEIETETGGLPEKGN